MKLSVRAAIDALRPMSRFFIERPRFAVVVSLVLAFLGLVSLRTLPVAQYPEVMPPAISVACEYPGANTHELMTTVANVIASAPTEGDTIEVYDDTALVYRTWTYGNDVWTPQTVAGVDKQAAAAFRLAAGKAFRYVRAESNTAPVVVAANYEIKEITTTILEPGSEVGKESWNLVGNPNPSESFDLNEIKVGETTGDNVDLDADKVIVPTVHGGRKLYTLELDQTTNRKVWGYDASEVVVRPNGLKIRRNVRKTDDTKIAPGQVIWYLSGEKSAKPSFQWQK